MEIVNLTQNFHCSLLLLPSPLITVQLCVVTTQITAQQPQQQGQQQNQQQSAQQQIPTTTSTSIIMKDQPQQPMVSFNQIISRFFEFFSIFFFHMQIKFPLNFQSTSNIKNKQK